MMNTNQMELVLKVKPARLTLSQKQRRVERAQWWFAQMRRIVAAQNPKVERLAREGVLW